MAAQLDKLPSARPKQLAILSRLFYHDIRSSYLPGTTLARGGNVKLVNFLRDRRLARVQNETRVTRQ